MVLVAHDYDQTDSVNHEVKWEDVLIKSWIQDEGRHAPNLSTTMNVNENFLLARKEVITTLIDNELTQYPIHLDGYKLDRLKYRFMLAG